MIYTRGNLIVYDLKGKIYYQSGTSRSDQPIPEHEIPSGTPYIIVEYEKMQNKMVVSIDVSATPHKPVFADISVIPTVEELNSKIGNVELQSSILDLKVALLMEEVSL